MNPKHSDEEWKRMFKMRSERLSRLISLGAPTIVIDREAKMVRDAIHHGKWKTLLHDIRYFMRERSTNVYYGCRLAYFKHVRKMEEDDAIAAALFPPTSKKAS